MKVAFIKKDITPKKNCHMAGYSRVEKSIGVLDPIEINTLVWEINNQIFVLCCLDSILLEKEFVDLIKNECHTLTNVPIDHIQLCCIHTHSAPAFFKLTFEDTLVEPDLKEEAKTHMIDSILTAYSNLQECSVTYSTCMIDGYYGNRNIVDGECDKSVNILTFYDKNLQIITSCLNISVHPTILSGKNHYLSSDLLGRIRTLYSHHTEAPTMITNGTCGDVSTRFYRDKNEIIKLENTAHAIIEQIMTKSEVTELYLDEMQFTSANYTTHSDFSHDETTLNLLKNQDSQVDLLRKRCELKLAMGQFDLQLLSTVIKMNDLILITLPGDLVSHFGNKIKTELSPFKVILICYSNMYSNYLVNKEQYGQYFETYNSRCNYGEADCFIENVIGKTKELISS